MPIYCWCVSWWAGRQHSRASNNIYNGCLVSPRYHSYLQHISALLYPPTSHWPRYSGGVVTQTSHPLLALVWYSLYLSWEEWSLNCPVNQILIIAVFVFTSSSPSPVTGRGGGGLGVSSWDIFVCNQSSEQSNEWEDEPSWRCKISQSVSWETHHSFVDWLSPPRLLWTEDFFQDCFVLFFHQKLDLPSQTRYTCASHEKLIVEPQPTSTSSLLAY